MPAVARSRPQSPAVAWIVCVFASWVLAACRDRPLTDPAARPGSAVAASAAPVGEQADSAAAALVADSLARGLALAMRDSAVRQQVLEDMRDSPAARHALHLASYLRGARGDLLGKIIARQGGLAHGRVLAGAAMRAGFQLEMPDMLDRAMWTGTPDVVVVSRTAPIEQHLRTGAPLRGYTVDGTSVSLAADRPTGYRVLEVGPVSVNFGRDPEADRTATPRRARRTLSTPDEELAALPGSTVRRSAAAGTPNAAGGTTPSLVPCGQGDESCYGSGEQYSGGLVLPSIKGLPECYAPYHYTGAPLTDRDQDKWDDVCEYELADAFRPTQAFSYRDCDITSEPYWAATGGSQPGQIKILYALSYHQDCGSPVVNSGIGSHLGDSEFIVVYVNWISNLENPQTGKWRLDHVFLAAHWHTRASSSGDYDGGSLEYRTTYRGRPRIWVAEDKHGSYRSQAVCDAGAAYLDNCDRNTDFGAGPQVLQNFNLGQSAVPLLGGPGNPVASRFGNPGKYPGWEWFWTDDTFCGWYPRDVCGAGAGPYRESLSFFGF